METQLLGRRQPGGGINNPAANCFTFDLVQVYRFIICEDFNIVYNWNDYISCFVGFLADFRYFDNCSIFSVILQEEKYQTPASLLLLFVICEIKLKLFGFLTVGRSKQDICLKQRCLISASADIFHFFPSFNFD